MSSNRANVMVKGKKYKMCTKCKKAKEVEAFELGKFVCNDCREKGK